MAEKYAVRNLRLCTKDCLCLYVCPTGATDTEDSIIDTDKCIGCGACAGACPSSAISMVPREMPPQQPKEEKVVEALRALIQSKARAENLAAQGVKVSVIDFAPHVLSELLDPECCAYVEAKMAGAGVMPFTGVALEGISGNGRVEKVLTSRRPMKADAVLLAMGNRPNTEFLADSGLEMFKGTLLVDGDMRTSDPDIYAVGDCALVTNRITGQRQW